MFNVGISHYRPFFREDADTLFAMKRALYIIWQIVWGLPQSFLGAILFLAIRPKRYGMFKGAVVGTWPKSSSVSLGLFIFVAENMVRKGELLSDPHAPSLRKLIAHEYGHTIQSLFLGPFYLLVIGLPSVLWANTPALRRKPSCISSVPSIEMPT